MSDICETVGAVLGLYAEGELHDARAVELVREHLLDCVACRDELASYDSLTRMLLAGEPESLRDAGDGWIDPASERRVEGVLRRLNWTPATGAGASADGALHTERAAGARARPAPARARGSRLDLRLDDPLEPPARSAGRTPGADRAFVLRGAALAAAALFAITCLWLAFAPPGGPPGDASPPGGLVSREEGRSPPVLVGPGDPDRYDLDLPRRRRDGIQGDRVLGWVVADGGPRFRFARSSGTARGSEPGRLYGVGYRPHASGVPSIGRPPIGQPPIGQPPVEAEIEYVAEVVISEFPPEYEAGPPRQLYQLVPEVRFDVTSPGAAPRPGAASLWFQLDGIDRRPGREEPAPRLTIDGSTIYRIYVYRVGLELPEPAWTDARWRSPTRFGIEPDPLPAFTDPPLRAAHYRTPNLKF